MSRMERILRKLLGTYNLAAFETMQRGSIVKYPLREECCTRDGHMIYSQQNGAGGRTYWSDSVGGGVIVWDTCLVSKEELLLAMFRESLHDMQLQSQSVASCSIVSQNADYVH